MVRACCVNTCKSGKGVPSHVFPKDKERRKKWFDNLCLTNVEDEKLIKKLRVCYKHFKEDNYSGSTTRGVLIHSANPSINIAQENVEVVEANITKETPLIDVNTEIQINMKKYRRQRFNNVNKKIQFNIKKYRR